MAQKIRAAAGKQKRIHTKDAVMHGEKKDHVGRGYREAKKEIKEEIPENVFLLFFGGIKGGQYPKCGKSAMKKSVKKSRPHAEQKRKKAKEWLCQGRCARQSAPPDILPFLPFFSS
jgi:hypothetical protein